jgi:mono/diheme cytochrome c family protein
MKSSSSRPLRIVFMASAAIALMAAGTSEAETPQKQVTFTRDVAPIFQEKCEACHRPGSIAPMSLRSYEDSRPWVRSIRSRVESRQMPPWHIDRTVGIQQFKNDRSLSDDQIATILAWVDQGAPKGETKDMPAPRVWPADQGWNYAARFGQKEPDLIIRGLPWTQKAGQGNTWFKRMVETGVTEPRWVRAIEVRPGSVKGRQIMHHANVDIDQIEPDGTVTVGRFMEWAVGKEGELMRPNTGKLMLPGSRIAWDVHYASTKEDVTDTVEMGVYFYPKGQEPRYRQTLLSVGSVGVALDIPPNSIVAHEGYFVLPKGARIESFQPHMHLRGKAQSLEAILPTGQKVMLSHVDNFNFNWHNAYVYADDAAPLLPKGTVLKATSWHDNTAANKANPDPSVWVGYGDRTVDEMNHIWVNVTYMNEEDYLAEIEARNVRLSQQQQQQ